MEENRLGVVGKAARIVGRVSEYFTGFMILCVLLLITIQVVLRLLNMPLFGIEELLQFPTIWIYMLGGVCASYTRSHIDCGMAEAFIKSQKVVAIINLVKSVVTTGIALFVLTWAATYAQYSLRMNKTSAILGIPMKLGEVTILVGLVLMALYAVLDLVLSIMDTRKTMKEGGEG